MRIVVHHDVVLFADKVTVPSMLTVYTVDEVKDENILNIVFKNMINYIRKMGYEDSLGVFNELY